MLWNQQVHYCIYKHLPRVPILNQSNPINTSPPRFLKTHFNIVLPSTPRSFKQFSTTGLPTQLLYVPLLCPIRATCPTPLNLLYLMARMTSGEECTAWSSLSCRLFHCPATSSLLGSNIFLITLFSNTLSLHSPLNVIDEAPHPYKTIGKIIVL